VSGTPTSRVEIDAPAKLNLGLEVIGRREDGFHEIATIFLAIDLCDRLALTPNPSPIAMGEGGNPAVLQGSGPMLSGERFALRCDDPALAISENLAIRALEALDAESPLPGWVQIDLQKQIPAAAGLGGASSDAAATLIAARELFRLPVSDEVLHAIAARLGSDVPFFLRGGCALGRGRGEILDPLPVPNDLWFVLVVPRIMIPHKTASLYARLNASDLSDGGRVVAQAERIAASLPLDPDLLGNAFARPLYAVVPDLAGLQEQMCAAGAGVVGISGAGPTHFALFTDSERAEDVADRLRQALGNEARVIPAKPAAERPVASSSL
jgi:4-diphosphocytidyl-2-C-methyl-D-erythritol kinase